MSGRGPLSRGRARAPALGGAHPVHQRRAPHGGPSARALRARAALVPLHRGRAVLRVHRPEGGGRAFWTKYPDPALRRSAAAFRALSGASPGSARAVKRRRRPGFEKLDLRGGEILGRTDCEQRPRRYRCGGDQEAVRQRVPFSFPIKLDGEDCLRHCGEC